MLSTININLVSDEKCVENRVYKPTYKLGFYREFSLGNKH